MPGPGGGKGQVVAYSVVVSPVSALSALSPEASSPVPAASASPSVVPVSASPSWVLASAWVSEVSSWVWVSLPEVSWVSLVLSLSSVPLRASR